jgi:hypothetical protein
LKEKGYRLVIVIAFLLGSFFDENRLFFCLFLRQGEDRFRGKNSTEKNNRL